MVTSRYIHASWSRDAAQDRRPLSRGQAKGGKGFEKLAPEGGNGFEKPHPRGGKGFEKVVRKGSLRFENRHMTKHGQGPIEHQIRRSLRLDLFIRNGCLFSSSFQRQEN